MDYLKKEHINFIDLTCGLQIALILILWITLFGVLFSNESTTNDSSKTVEELQQAIVTELRKLSQCVTDNSINECRRRLEAVIPKMAADTSNIATWLQQPHVILVLSRDKCSQ